jgi:5-methyltetrahydropteroyltriglutamate--homocysteine methyltransferase
VTLTTVIGSYPRRYEELGAEAVLQSVNDQLEAGIDLVSDGQTRYDMIEYFARAITGYTFTKGSAIEGKIGRGDPALFSADLAAARRLTPHVKGIITGPVTLVFASRIRGFYRGYRDINVYLDTAAALLDIARALEAGGAEWLQIDEPYLSVGAPMDIAREAVETIATGLKVPVALHVCGKVAPIFEQLVEWQGISLLSHAFMGDDNAGVLGSARFLASGKMLGLGCIDTRTERIEEADAVEKMIRRALEKIPPDRLVIHPDCGLRLLPRASARGKMKSMVAAARRFDSEKPQ